MGRVGGWAGAQECGEYEPTRIGAGWACATALDWLKPVSEQLSSSVMSIDVIIACDCLFLKKLIDPLLDDIISVLFDTMATPRLLFTYQRRHLMGVFIGLEDLLERIELRGLHAQCVAWRNIEVEGDGTNELYLFEVTPNSTTNGNIEEEKKEGAA